MFQVAVMWMRQVILEIEEVRNAAGNRLSVQTPTPSPEHLCQRILLILDRKTKYQMRKILWSCKGGFTKDWIVNIAEVVEAFT